MTESQFAQMQAVTKLAQYLNCWLYSVEEPPQPARVVWADWVLRGRIPTMEQVNKAIAESELTIKRQGREGE